MEFDTLESTKDRLLNWQRAYRNHEAKRVTMSLEGRYRSPLHWDVKEVSPIIDLLDAHEVEIAWLGTPSPQKEILKYNYFNPYIPLQKFCRLVKIAPRDFEIELGRSIRMIDNRLRK